jgi:hypothetical protein
MAKPLTFKQKAALKIAQAKSAAKRKGKKLKGNIANKLGRAEAVGKFKLSKAKRKLSKLSKKAFDGPLGKADEAVGKALYKGNKKVKAGIKKAKASVVKARAKTKPSTNALRVKKAAVRKSRVVKAKVKAGVKSAKGTVSKTSKSMKSRTNNTAKLRSQLKKKKTAKVKSVNNLNKTMKQIGATPLERGQASKFMKKTVSKDPRKKR